MKTYAQLNDSMTGRCALRRKLANNTYAEKRADGCIAIRLHNTDIVTFFPSGKIVATTGGWKTSTTKNRLNEYLPFRIWQSKGVWSFSHNEKTYIFADGLTIAPDGILSGFALPSQVEEDKKLRKQVNEYCTALVAALPLPCPGAGDCFYCQMKEVETGKPLGEAMKDTSHLHSHLEEKYFVPSLVWQALVAGGCNPQGGGAAWFEKAFGEKLNHFPGDTVKRMVRKYLLRQFGLA